MLFMSVDTLRFHFDNCDEGRKNAHDYVNAYSVIFNSELINLSDRTKNIMIL